MIAGATVIVAVALLVFVLGRGAAPAPVIPSMGNVGNAGAPGAASLAGPAPDISQMSPTERFTRLNDRVMVAATNGDSTTVITFTPMALAAYAQLDTVTVDSRYHAAVLHAQVGELDQALALADTIQAGAPRNLFGYVIRGTIAELRRDVPSAAEAYRGFLDAFDAEVATSRPEYQDHRDILNQFRSSAQAILQ